MSEYERTEMIQEAILRGVSEIIKAHPKFRGQESYIRDHLDPESIRREIEEINRYIINQEKKQKTEFSDETKQRIIYNMLMNSSASGELLDEAGKEVILRKSLEERIARGPVRRDVRRELEGERALDNAITAFRDLYSLMKTGDYAGHMPELAKAVSTVYNMGFLSSSLDILKHYGLIDRNRYNLLRKSVLNRAEVAVTETHAAIENYSSTPAKKDGDKKLKNAGKVSSAILAMGGASFLLSSSSITGNVLGISLSNSSSLLGISFLATAAALFLATFIRGENESI